MAVITRSEWGAGPQQAPRINLPVSRLYLHHTVTPEWTGAEAARRIQDIALGRGFLDISYSWLVDVEGNEIEGRGWGRQGAHTAGYNSTSHAISLIGNFHTRHPPRAMLLAVARLCRKHGTRGPARITHGHRDVSSTACPGDYAYGAIGVINQLAANYPQQEDQVTPEQMQSLKDHVTQERQYVGAALHEVHQHLHEVRDVQLGPALEQLDVALQRLDSIENRLTVLETPPPPST